MDSPARQPVLSSGQQRFLLCLAACIVPESAGAPPQVTAPPLAAVDEELQPRPRLQQIEFKLLLFATFAASLWHTIVDAALEYGVEVEP